MQTDFKQKLAKQKHAIEQHISLLPVANHTRIRARLWVSWIIKNILKDEGCNNVTV